MPSAAVERRYEAIGAISDFVLSDTRINPVGTPAQIAGLIREIKGLGRTPRWQNAIETWARMVETGTPEYALRANPNGHSLRWAFIQWLVYANYAACGNAR